MCGNYGSVGDLLWSSGQDRGLASTLLGENCSLNRFSIDQWENLLELLKSLVGVLLKLFVMETPTERELVWLGLLASNDIRDYSVCRVAKRYLIGVYRSPLPFLYSDLYLGRLWSE